jgi:hypothetical protein
MVKRRGERGLTILEVVIATSVATVVTSAAVVATGTHFEFARVAFERAVAERAVAARLEALAAGAALLVPGQHAFALHPSLAASVPGARAEETIEEVESGLFAIEAAVVFPDGRTVHLETIVAAEVPK